MAILTRPNLTPIVIVPALLAIVSSARPWLGAGVFAASSAVGVGLLFWMQSLLYGSFAASGHLGIEQAFSLEHVADNWWRYPRWYLEFHTPAIVLAVLAPLLIWRSGRASGQHWRRAAVVLAASLLLFATGIYLAYLPYTPFDHRSYLRFMLPALGPLYALTAAVLAISVARLATRRRVATLLVLMAATAGAQLWQTRQSQVTEHWRDNTPVRLAGAYLREALPANAVVLTFFHSGTVRYLTGRPIVRLDLVAPQLDTIVAMVQLFGYRPYLLLDETLERAGFEQPTVSETRTGRLDWPPRARIGDAGRLSLYDLGDPQRLARGERWPTDIVR